ncbi:hypothetical protein HNP65_001428 [Thermosipho japonicus]|uniref:Flagellar Assembly Protein A N-terminal region domain-containing protein n=1 Tax=Thermosipho japonicus TaxID=90323 RepID=A0A841GLT5_9BACT|nr:FapA family protein [Thermosipho japonicus]MBB6062965.1 hypothetical protein [Thermosipho japonicus]
MIVKVKVPENKMSASIILEKASDDDKVTPKEIVDALNEAGVKYGIDYNVINRICQNPEFSVPLQVAVGKEPKNGEDGRIEFVNFEKEKESDKKNIDFREFPTHKRIIVRKGQKIATVYEPTEGEDGINVFGEKIPGKVGNKVEIKLGNNVELKDNSIYSKVDGILIVNLNENFIDIGEVLEIKGDVDYSIGNIDFPGEVVITGDVKPGFVVRSKKDIKVEGIIEAATVISLEGNIIVSGIKGRDKGIVKCSKDLIVRFAENANLEAKNLIFKDLLNNCNVKVSESIIAENGRGVIVGGEYIAGVKIEAEEIGSEMGIPTHLEVGIPPHLLEERKLLHTQIMLDKQNAEKLMKIVKQYKLLKEKKVDIPNDKKQLFVKATTTLLNIKEQLEKNKKRLDEIEEMINKIKVDAKVVARKVIYPGVEIMLQGLKYYINKPLTKAVLRIENDNIIVGGYKE